MSAPANLRRACRQGDARAVEQLVRDGEFANALYREQTGESLLFISAQHGHADVCAALLAAGAEAYVNRARHDGTTPLHMAAQNGRDDVVRRLLQGRAVVNRARRADGRTALFYAVKQGHVAVVQTLLQCGADPNLAVSALLPPPPPRATAAPGECTPAERSPPLHALAGQARHPASVPRCPERQARPAPPAPCCRSRPECQAG